MNYQELKEERQKLIEARSKDIFSIKKIYQQKITDEINLIECSFNPKIHAITAQMKKMEHNGKKSEIAKNVRKFR